MRNRWIRSFVACSMLAVLCSPTTFAQQAMSSKMQQMLRTRNSTQIVARWRTQIQRLEKLLLEGKSEKVLKNGTALAAEMVSLISSGESGQILGAVNVLRAIAAYNLGDERQALWHWQTGLQMFPELADEELGRFGAAVEFLHRNPARTDEGSEKMSLAEPANVSRPRKKKAPPPQFPPAKLGAGPLAIVVSAIIDKEGRPTSPRIVRAEGEFSLVCAALEAFWKWEFEPATRDGEPVDVYYNLTVNFNSNP